MVYSRSNSGETLVRKKGLDSNSDNKSLSPRDLSILQTHENIEIPVSVLSDRSLSVLEVLAEYLKETLNLTYHQIAVLTNRDDRTIWTVYNRAQKKRKEHPKPQTPDSEILIPLKVLLDRDLSVLEVLAEFLKEQREFTYHEIAVLTNRDDRTIWTVYNRAKKKRAAV